MHRHALFTELESRLGDLRQSHRPEPGKHRTECTKSCRNAGSEQPLTWNEMKPEAAVIVQRGTSGRHHIAIDRNNSPELGDIEQHRRITTDGMHVWIDNALEQGGGHCGVKCITPAGKDSRTRGR